MASAVYLCAFVGDLKAKEIGRWGGAFIGGCSLDEEKRGEGQGEKAALDSVSLSLDHSKTCVPASWKEGVEKPSSVGSEWTALGS